MNSDAIHCLLDRLAECTATPGRGVTRFSFSPEDGRARAIIVSELAALGCRAWTDWAGNIHALIAGHNSELLPVAVGSHLDSVRNGGPYDGAVGIVGALAAMARLRATGVRPERGVRFIAFAEEEGSNFNIPLMGSKAFTRSLAASDLAGVVNQNGVSALELMAETANGNALRPEWMDAGVHCMIELHIEQGPSLDEAGADIGVVDRIAADSVLTVALNGRSGHSGASAMRGRRDALAGAAEITVALETLANAPEGEGAVITVGSIRCYPNSFNCIPERVEFTIDIRHPDPDALKRVDAGAEDLIQRIAQRRCLEHAVKSRHTAGVILDSDIRSFIEKAAAKRGYDWRTTPSWAMHDTGAVAATTPAGMIFVPSRGGISHNPMEYTEPAAIERGIDVLCDVVAGIAGRIGLAGVNRISET